jgi:hypothetical protein
MSVDYVLSVSDPVNFHGTTTVQTFGHETRYYSVDRHELEAMHPGRTVTQTSKRPFENAVQRWERRQKERDAIRERERAQLTAARLREEHAMIGDWNGQGMNEDGDIT